MGSVVKNTALISVLTLASRVMGVLRDALIAAVFGVTPQSDAFFIAFRPFDLIRKLLSEGMLSISFIPVFSQIMIREGRAKAMSMAFSFFLWASFAAVVLMGASILFAPKLVAIISLAPSSISIDAALTIVLFKIMLPYIWLVFASAICMGILNSLGHFGLPALAPILFNLAVISSVTACAAFFNCRISVLAAGVIIGGIIQVTIQIVPVARAAFGYIKTVRILCPQTWQAIKVLFPCMIGAGAYQINIVIASVFATGTGDGSVSHLYFADRLVQFPMALFAVSTATVFLPELSKMNLDGRLDDTGRLFSAGVRLVLFLTFPAMAGYMVLNKTIVTLLFGHGAFSNLAVQKTGECLLFLSAGLWSFTLQRLFATFYYATKQFSFPFYAGLISIGLNLALCILLYSRMGLNGLALAVAAASLAGVLFMVFSSRRSAAIDTRGIGFCACRSLFLSGIMATLVKIASRWIPDPAQGTVMFAGTTLGCIAGGILFYLGANYMISSPELGLIKKAMGKKQHDTA